MAVFQQKLIRPERQFDDAVRAKFLANAARGFSVIQLRIERIRKPLPGSCIVLLKLYVASSVIELLARHRTWVSNDW